MKRLSFLLVWASLLGVVAVVAAAPAEAKCKEGFGFTVCPGAERVNLSGTSSITTAESASGKSATNFSSFTCNHGTANALASAGDANAIEDASQCTTESIGCGISAISPGQRQIAMIGLRRGSNGWTYNGTNCVVVGGAPPVVTAEMVRQQVVRLVPSAAVGLAPKTVSLVNIQTIMWVEAPEHRTLAPLTILGQRVLVNLSLDHVDWRFGDGGAASPTSAGKAYTDADPCRSRTCPGYFGHTYRSTGRLTLAATTTWRASFSVRGAPAVNIPGAVAGPRATAGLIIKQARAVLVANPGN